MEKNNVSNLLTSIDDLFTTQEEREISKLQRIFEIPISEIDDFPNHPFQVRMDDDMEQLIQSVQERGVITPITLRQKEDGRYELVSGHRRKKACELVGIERIKAEIRDLNDDEAIILMVESNLQRSVILPSEKAFSYKMRLDAIKRQGYRTDLTSSPLGTKLRSDDNLAREMGDSRNQIQRYIRLTKLIPPILELVDIEKIGFRPAVEISYLTSLEQEQLYEAMQLTEATPSLAQALKMKVLSKEGKLSSDVTKSILEEEKPNQKEKIVLKIEKARPFLPPGIPYHRAEEYILKALAFYQRYIEKQKGRERE